MREELKERYRASFEEWSTTLYGVPAHDAVQQATNAKDLRGRPEKAFLLVFQDSRQIVFGEQEARRQAAEGGAVAVQLETFSEEQMERIRAHYQSGYDLEGFAGLMERMRARLEEELDRAEGGVERQEMDVQQSLDHRRSQVVEQLGAIHAQLLQLEQLIQEQGEAYPALQGSDYYTRLRARMDDTIATANSVWMLVRDRLL